MALTSLPVMGHDEVVQWGYEGTYNSAATADDCSFRPASNTLAAHTDISPLQGPSGYMVPYLYDASLPRHYASVPNRSGQIVLECDYDFVGHVLAAALGNPTTTDGVNAATHVFTIPLATPSTMGPSLTLERITGQEDWRFTGVYCNSVTFRGQAGQYITATLDLVAGGGGQASVTPASSTFSALPWCELFHSDVSVSTDLTVGNLVASAGTGEDVEEWTLTINNNILIEQAAGGGSLGIRPPVYADFRTVELSWRSRWNSDTYFDLIHPATEDARYKYVRLYLDEGTDAGDGTNTSLQFDMPAAIFLGDVATYEGGGGSIVQNVRCQAAADGSNAPLTVTLVNSHQEADTGGVSYGTSS